MNELYRPNQRLGDRPVSEETMRAAQPWDERLAYKPMFPDDSVQAPSDMGREESQSRRNTGYMPCVVALAMLAAAAVVGFVLNAEIFAFLATMGEIGSGNPNQEMKGFIAASFIGVVIVAVVKILTAQNNRDRK